MARAGTMPRSPVLCVLFLVGACSFEADYSAGGFTCEDGRCPAGLECSVEQVCGPPADAAVDTPSDIPDASEPALTCDDPGLLASGTVFSGDTAGKPMVVAPLCNGFVMNGREAVYRIEAAAGDQLLVEILQGPLRAYVIDGADCPTATTCIANAVAIRNVPATVSPGAGVAYVIVDHELAGTDGTYQLKVTVQ
jgi:hypothetical protein